MAMGNVNTQERRIPPMTPSFALPLTMPMPVIAPTETCVVDTGTPMRLAMIAIKPVTQFAVSAWPSFNYGQAICCRGGGYDCQF
jgi:hypothetical protein